MAAPVAHHLRSPCAVLSGAALRIGEDSCGPADLAVACEPPGSERLIQEPYLAVEILSASTIKDDPGLEIMAYPDLPTLRENRAIDSERRAVGL